MPAFNALEIWASAPEVPPILVWHSLGCANRFLKIKKAPHLCSASSDLQQRYLFFAPAPVPAAAGMPSAELP